MSSASGVVTSVTGANGITATPTTGAVVISGIDATTSSVGVASFNPLEFTVTGGEVSLIGGGAPGTVTTVSVVTANGLAGTVANPTTTPAITISTTATGVLSGNGTAISGSPVTQHGVVIGEASNAVGTTAVGTTGTILQGNTGADPTYSTATYPSTTTMNQILYSSSANVVTGLATANNGVLITSSTGVPSILADGTTGQVLTATTGGAPSWSSPATSGTVTSVSVTSANGFAGTVATATTTPAITISTTATGVLSGNGTAISGSSVTQYDVLVGGATNAISSVGPGTAGQILQSGGNATNPAYSTSTYPATNAINTLLYASSANVMSALATANNGVLITSASGVPSLLADGTTGQVLTATTGSPPTWGSLASAGAVTTLSDDVGTTVSPNAGNIQLVGHVVEQGSTKFSTVVAGTNLLNINPMSGSRWIVDKLGFNGTHTTIASAITSATSGDTIFLLPGTYTENLTLKAGVNLTAFGSDSSLNGVGNVIISGTCTLSTAGTVTISGIELQTNSAPYLTVSGSVASVVNLNNCYLNALNNTGISYSSSSASSAINCSYCTGNIGTTSIAYYTMSSLGELSLQYCNMGNSGASTTASSNSAGGVFVEFSTLSAPVSTSSTGFVDHYYSTFNSSPLNTTALTLAGTGTSLSVYSQYEGGTASAISVGSGTTFDFYNGSVNSSNTDAITGGGTAVISGLTYSGSSHLSNITAQTGGAINGITQGTAPSVGMIGEQIRGVLVSGSAATLTTNTPANIITLSLTAGIWDVCCLGVMNGGVTGTSYAISISLNSATQGTDGDANCGTPTSPTAIESVYLTVAGYRVTLATTTNVYMVANALFTVGTLKCYGRISATRVG